MRKRWERFQVIRDGVEWFLGVANVFVWAVFTPIFCLSLAAMIGAKRSLFPYTDAEKRWEQIITTGQIASLIAVIPALMVVWLIFVIFQNYHDSEDFGADIRDPATNKRLPMTVIFTRHLPAMHPVLALPLAAWWGLGGLFFAAINATRKGIMMPPKPVDGTTFINPVDFAVCWIVSSTFIFGLSSAVAMALAVKAATGSERMVIAFWRLRYWYCLALSLFGYVMTLVRWTI